MSIPSVRQFLKRLRPIDRLKLISLFIAMVSLTLATIKSFLLRPLTPLQPYLSLLILLIMAAYFFGITVGLVSSNEENKEKDYKESKSCQ